MYLAQLSDGNNPRLSNMTEMLEMAFWSWLARISDEALPARETTTSTL